MFGENLKKLREGLGLTQKQLADKLGVNRATIGGYETKGKEPSYDTLFKLAKIFNCSLDVLLGDNKENRSSYEVQEISPEIKGFYERLADRKDLQLLIRETEDLNSDSINRIVKIINLIKEEKNTK